MTKTYCDVCGKEITPRDYYYTVDVRGATPDQSSRDRVSGFSFSTLLYIPSIEPVEKVLCGECGSKVYDAIKELFKEKEDPN